MGNRLTQVDASGTSTYSYATGNNRLSSIAGANPSSFTSDANGNTLSENAKIFTYNQNQRLIQAASTQTGNYVYNANGQRVKKTVGGAVTVYHYDQNGQLIAESSNTGAVQAEYVYLNGIPLAKIDGSGTQYIHTDHLGTPVMMTDAARAIVWEIENRPFGDGATVTGTATLNLRFPGQYYDAESGLNYNYFRDYNPTVGRYVEADPIGLDSEDASLFIYVENNSVNWIDPLGLCTFKRKAGDNPARDISLIFFKQILSVYYESMKIALKDAFKAVLFEYGKVPWYLDKGYTATEIEEDVNKNYCEKGERIGRRLQKKADEIFEKHDCHNPKCITSDNHRKRLPKGNFGFKKNRG